MKTMTALVYCYNKYCLVETFSPIKLLTPNKGLSMKSPNFYFGVIISCGQGFTL